MLLFVVLFLILIGLYKDIDISHVLTYLCFTDLVFEFTLKVNGAICIAGKGVKKKIKILQISNILENRIKNILAAMPFILACLLNNYPNVFYICNYLI